MKLVNPGPAGSGPSSRSYYTLKNVLFGSYVFYQRGVQGAIWFLTESSTPSNACVEPRSSGGYSKVFSLHINEYSITYRTISRIMFDDQYLTIWNGNGSDNNPLQAWYGDAFSWEFVPVYSSTTTAILPSLSAVAPCPSTALSPSGMWRRLPFHDMLYHSNICSRNHERFGLGSLTYYTIVCNNLLYHSSPSRPPLGIQRRVELCLASLRLLTVILYCFTKVQWNKPSLTSYAPMVFIINLSSHFSSLTVLILQLELGALAGLVRQVVLEDREVTST